MIWLEISVNKKYKPIKPTKRTIKKQVLYRTIHSIYKK